MFVSLIWYVKCEAAITVIIAAEKDVENVNCPKVVHGSRQDLSNMTSKINIKFVCIIGYANVIKKIQVDHHITVKPLFSSNILGCQKFDHCFKMKTFFINMEKLQFNIIASPYCLQQILTFNYEVRKQNMLVKNGSTEVFVSNRAPVPSFLNFMKTGTEILLKSKLKAICGIDISSSQYYFEYKMRSSLQYYGDRNLCNVIKKFGNSSEYLLECFLVKPKNFSMCDTVFNMNIISLNRYGIRNMSKKFSYILAFLQETILKVAVSNETISSFSISFKSPIPCAKSQIKLKCKISLKSLKIKGRTLDFLDTCNKPECRTQIDNLEINNRYWVCVTYKALYLHVSYDSKKYCVIGRTKRRPCSLAILHNMTHISIDQFNWKAVLRISKTHCDGVQVNEATYILVQVKYGTDDIFNNIILHSKNSYAEILVHNLKTSINYTLSLSSCSSYGCVQDIVSRLYLNSSKFTMTHKTVLKSIISSSQITISTILICFFSILFLVMSFILYIILRRGKILMLNNIKNIKLQKSDIIHVKNVILEDNENSDIVVHERVPGSDLVDHLIPKGSTLV